MTLAICRDCGARGDEDADDLAPNLCPHCFGVRMERYAGPAVLERWLETYGAEIAIGMLHEALIRDVGMREAVADEHEELLRAHFGAVEEECDQEPDIDDEPPPDYGPPGSGAVIVEWP